jgi:hypothetical protein
MTSYPIIHKSTLDVLDPGILKRLLQKRPQVYLNNGSFYKLRDGTIGYNWDTVDKTEYLTNEEIQLASLITISTAINFKDPLNTFGIYIGQSGPFQGSIAPGGPFVGQDPLRVPAGITDRLKIDAMLFFTDMDNRFTDITKNFPKKNVFCYLVPTVPAEHHATFLNVYLTEASKYTYVNQVYLGHFKKFCDLEPVRPWSFKIHTGTKNIVGLLKTGRMVSNNDLIVGLWHACPNSYIGNDYHVSLNTTSDSESSMTSTNHNIDLCSFDFFKVY